MTVGVLYGPAGSSRILSYILYPMLASSHYRNLVFTTREDEVVSWRKRGKIRGLLVVGQGQEARHSDAGSGVHDWSRLRDCFERLGYFHITGNPRSINEPLLSAVDYYFKAALLRDRSRYAVSAVGGSAWADWYHQNVSPLSLPVTPAVTDIRSLEKLRLAWNVGLGLYPKTRITKRVPPIFERAGALGLIRFLRPRTPRSYGKTEREPGLQARLTVRGNTAYSVHREFFLEKARCIQGVRTGKIGRHEYTQEMRSIAAVLSPFGSGEACYRDFEAIQSGAALMKPSMEHLETWPNVYTKGCYVPLAWDGTDLRDAYELALATRRRLGEAAFQEFSDGFRKIEDRVEQMLSLLDA